MNLAEVNSSQTLNFPTVAGWTAWGRVVLYAVFFLSTQAYQINQGDFLNLSIWQSVNLLVLGAMSLQLYTIENPQNFPIRKLIFFSFVTDSILILSLIAVLGFFHSSQLFALLMIVAISGFVLGLKSAFILGLFISIGTNLIFNLSHYFQADQMVWSSLVNQVSVIAVASLSGVMGQQYQFVFAEVESKTAELRNLTDLNELIVDNIPSGLLMLDPEGRIMKANRGALKLFEDLRLEGKKIEELWPEFAQSFFNLRTNVTSGKTHRMELQRHNQRNEKSIYEAILSVVRSTDSLRRPFVLLIQNVTELKNLEFALQQKEKLAAVGQLAAGIAHEIRNPLASISGSVQLLQAHLQTQTVEDSKLFSIVIREIDRLNDLISEFLDFVRPEVNVKDPIQLNKLLKDLLELVKLNPKLSQKVDQIVELRSGKVIHGHYDKLKQALLNIIINAYQAMSDTLRPQIYVKTHDEPGRVVLVIGDNGIGMTEENRRRLFEPFHTTKTGGTGLGLAITHKILEAHGVTVSVDSEWGRGTQFTLYFRTEDNDRDKDNLFKRHA